MNNSHFNDIANNVIQGMTDPLIAYAELKQFKREIDQALKDIEPIALEESDKYGKSFELHGIKFERRNGATRYDFKHIEQWQMMHQELKNFEMQSKQALAAMKHGANYIDENGEQIPVPKITYAKDSLITK
jgi:hypothetical protein